MKLLLPFLCSLVIVSGIELKREVNPQGKKKVVIPQTVINVLPAVRYLLLAKNRHLAAEEGLLPSYSLYGDRKQTLNVDDHQAIKRDHHISDLQSPLVFVNGRPFPNHQGLSNLIDQANQQAQQASAQLPSIPSVDASFPLYGSNLDFPSFPVQNRQSQPSPPSPARIEASTAASTLPYNYNSVYYVSPPSSDFIYPSPPSPINSPSPPSTRDAAGNLLQSTINGQPGHPKRKAPAPPPVIFPFASSDYRQHVNGLESPDVTIRSSKPRNTQKHISRSAPEEKLEETTPTPIPELKTPSTKQMLDVLFEDPKSSGTSADIIPAAAVSVQEMKMDHSHDSGKEKDSETNTTNEPTTNETTGTEAASNGKKTTEPVWPEPANISGTIELVTEPSSSAEQLRTTETPTTTAEQSTIAHPEITEQQTTTEAPAETTEAFEVHPEEDEEITETSKTTPGAPEQTSSAPEQTSAAPEQTSAAPEQTSAAPEQTTEAPEQTTEATEQITESAMSHEDPKEGSAVASIEETYSEAPADLPEPAPRVDESYPLKISGTKPIFPNSGHSDDASFPTSSKRQEDIESENTEIVGEPSSGPLWPHNNDGGHLWPPEELTYPLPSTDFNDNDIDEKQPNTVDDTPPRGQVQEPSPIQDTKDVVIKIENTKRKFLNTQPPLSEDFNMPEIYNQNIYCCLWASRGYCTAHEHWMMKNCYLSCGSQGCRDNGRPCHGFETCAIGEWPIRVRKCQCENDRIGRKCGIGHSYDGLSGNRCYY